MSYASDVQVANRAEKTRVFFIVVALALLAISVALDIQWLHWPRGIAWGIAGIAAFVEARAYKRLGRDPDSTYLRGVLCIIVGILSVL